MKSGILLGEIMQKKDADALQSFRPWKLAYALLLFSSLAGCGLRSIPYEEPLHVRRMGNLQMALPEDLEPQARFSAYAWAMEHGKLVVMEQPCRNPEKAEEEFDVVWEALHTEHSSWPAEESRTWVGDASHIFGTPARFGFCRYDRNNNSPVLDKVHALVLKDGFFLHLIMLVKSVAYDENIPLSGFLQEKDFLPEPSAPVRTALQDMADFVQLWRPASVRSGGNYFRTLNGTVDESSRPVDKWQEGCFKFIRPEDRLELSLEYRLSSWPSRGGWAERRYLNPSPINDGNPWLDGRVFGAFLWVLMNPIDMVHDIATNSDSSVARKGLREVNGLPGAETVYYKRYTDSKGNRMCFISAWWCHYGNERDVRLPAMQLHLKCDTSDPERVMGLWDAVLETLRPASPDVRPDPAEGFSGDEEGRSPEIYVNPLNVQNETSCVQDAWDAL